MKQKYIGASPLGTTHIFHSPDVLHPVTDIESVPDSYRAIQDGLRIFVVQPIELRSSTLRKLVVQPCVTLTFSLTQGWRGQLRKAEGVSYARLQLFHN